VFATMVSGDAISRLCSSMERRQVAAELVCTPVPASWHHRHSWCDLNGSNATVITGVNGVRVGAWFSDLLWFTSKQ
jgi:hypothetical protein